ncbi:MAG TPA: hypothetical protein VLA82_02345 [Actinomycetota bacterium]|nr:hypothetical protein [Actinomycetota bacterium]
MPKMSRLAASVTVALIVTAMLAGPASAKILRIYRGETSEGRRVSAQIVSKHGDLRMREIVFHHVDLACEDGTAQAWGLGFGFGGWPLSADRRFDFESVDPMSAVRIDGRFWPGHARGDFSFTVPALDENEQAILCTSGDLTWDLLRKSPNPIDELNTRSLDGVARVRLTDDGRLRVRTSEV